MAVHHPLLKKVNEAIARQTPYFSFEFFPPKTDEGLQNLYERIERMAQLNPTWIDVTWGAGGSSSEKTLEICSQLVSQNFEVMMHLTCTNVNPQEVLKTLHDAKAVGVRNILALRGDPPMKDIYETTDTTFQHAIDLVRFIKKNFGDYFSIAVAGYPEGHYSSTSFDEDIRHLKEKVEAGADMIISQLFYDVDMFNMFIRECKDAGITCPIVAGLMPIYSFERFERITHLTQVIIPEGLLRRLYPIKGNEEAIKEVGIEYLCEIIQNILDNKTCLGFHFYTLNLEKSVSLIIQKTKLQPKSLPYLDETIPTAHYMHKPKSEWDDFPNERWGDNRSPAFGNLINEVWYSSLANTQIIQDLVELSLEIKKEQDIHDLFTSFCKGKIACLPWVPDRLSSESTQIMEQLIWLNSHGFLTINSQPQVNGVLSTDKTFGWGDPNGYIYQKGYIEFFCSPENWRKLVEILHHSDFKSITYMACNQKGDFFCSEKQKRNALTWGIFPGQEVVQTTFVDEDSFRIWKSEAFSIWQKGWIDKLPKSATLQIEMLKHVMDNYFLVNLVENDYINGNVFKIFSKLCL